MDTAKAPNSAVTAKTAQVTLGDGVALQRKGQIDAAIAIYRAILKAHPNNSDAWNLLGTTAIEQGNLQLGKERLRRAIGHNPVSAVAHHNLGVLLRQLGELENSRHHLEEAIRLKPDYAEAYFNYAACRRFEEGNTFVVAVEDMLQNHVISDRERCFLHFAAGKYYDDIVMPDRAFAHYLSGNRLKGAHFDVAAQKRQCYEMKAAFDSSLLRRFRDYGHQSDVPIFVVGMPRSGTTLVEQVLASHPAVHGAGELRDISAIAAALPAHDKNRLPFPACVWELDARTVRGFAEVYLRRVRSRAPRAAHIVDKHPLNFQLVGLIAVMFPNARIIHCRRSPLDTCLSCFFQNFKSGQDYSFDLANLAHFYRLYHDLMDHWCRVLPGKLIEVVYEDLVENQEAESRRLLSELGLEWHPACREFFRTRRPVQTASSWQVRQPVYRSSLNRWQAYEKHLGPLIDVLGPLAAEG